MYITCYKEIAVVRIKKINSKIVVEMLNNKVHNSEKCPKLSSLAQYNISLHSNQILVRMYKF